MGRGEGRGGLLAAALGGRCVGSPCDDEGPPYAGKVKSFFVIFWE